MTTGLQTSMFASFSRNVFQSCQRLLTSNVHIANPDSYISSTPVVLKPMIGKECLTHDARTKKNGNNFVG